MENSVKITTPIVIIIVIMSVMLVSFKGWVHMVSTYMSEGLVSSEQIRINENINPSMFPVITANNIRMKQGNDFIIAEHVHASDRQDGDISNQLHFYGKVDTNVKGLYEIRCVVRNQLGLKSVKTIQVIVD